MLVFEYLVKDSFHESYLALDGLRDVVGGVADGVHGLSDDALVGSVGVRGRHFERCGGWW